VIRIEFGGPQKKTILEHPPASSPSNAPAPKPSQTPPPGRTWCSSDGLWQRKTTVIAAFSILGIGAHLVLRFGVHAARGTYELPARWTVS
jgi:hypothetical protein